jgi:hypothetical protein
VTPRPAPAVALLLDAFDEAYDRKAWHGPNLRGAVRGISEAEASWRPAPGRHNVWEIVVHAAYWKYAVRRRLTGARRGGFPLEGTNWYERPARGRRFREDVALLDREHRLLRVEIAHLPAAALGRRARGTSHRVARLVYGITAHDLYHTGQIRMLRTLSKSRAKRSA